MDPLAAIGGVAAALQIALELSKLARKLKRCIRNMKHALVEVECLLCEIMIFAGLLHSFSDTIGMIKDCTVFQEAEQSGLDKQIIRQSKRAKRQVEDLLVKLEPLRKDSGAAGWYKTLLRYRWSRQKGEVGLLQAQLNVAKMNLTLFISVMSLAKIIEYAKIGGMLRPEQEQQMSVVRPYMSQDCN